jgi:hypothetical protein
MNKRPLFSFRRSKGDEPVSTKIRPVSPLPHQMNKRLLTGDCRPKAASPLATKNYEKQTYA